MGNDEEDVNDVEDEYADDEDDDDDDDDEGDTDEGRSWLTKALMEKLLMMPINWSKIATQPGPIVNSLGSELSGFRHKTCSVSFSKS